MTSYSLQFYRITFMWFHNAYCIIILRVVFFIFFVV